MVYQNDYQSRLFDQGEDTFYGVRKPEPEWRVFYGSTDSRDRLVETFDSHSLALQFASKLVEAGLCADVRQAAVVVQVLIPLEPHHVERVERRILESPDRAVWALRELARRIEALETGAASAGEP